MLRYDRPRFMAHGLTATVNAVAFLLFAFNESFHTGSKLPMWTALGLCLACLLRAIACAVRRGRDLGWPGLATAVAFPLALGLMPTGLFLVGFLCIGLPQPRAARFGPPPPPAEAGALWCGALLGLLLPWAILLPVNLVN